MSEGKYSKNGIIALCSLVYFVSYFSRKGFAAVMAGMLQEAVLDKPTAGLVGTMLFVFYGAGQLLSGYLGDKIRPQHLLCLGLTVTSLCNLLMPLLPSSSLMIPVWGLNGLAQAMLWPPIVKILSGYLDHERYVMANLIVTSAAHVATILLYVFVPICLKYYSWETVFYVASALALISMLVFAVALRFVIPREAELPVSPKISTEEQGSASMGKAFISSGIIPILGCIIMCGFLRDGIESWLPTLYSEAFSRDSSESVLVSVVLPIFSILTVSLVTALHKKPLFNNETDGTMILFGVGIVLSVPLSLMIEAESVAARVICLILAALVCAAMHGVNFLLISCLPGRFAALGRASTVGGLVNSFVYIGAAISTYGIALIADNLGWRATVISWAGVALAGLLLSLLARKKYTLFIK